MANELILDLIRRKPGRLTVVCNRHHDRTAITLCYAGRVVDQNETETDYPGVATSLNFDRRLEDAEMHAHIRDLAATWRVILQQPVGFILSEDVHYPEPRFDHAYDAAWAARLQGVTLLRCRLPDTAGAYPVSAICGDWSGPAPYRPRMILRHISE